MATQTKKDVSTLPSDKDSTTEQARVAAHEMVDNAAGKVEKFEKKVRSEASRVTEAAVEGKDEAREKIDAGLRTVDGFIKERPLAAAGIAFGAGALAALLIRRS